MTEQKREEQNDSLSEIELLDVAMVPMVILPEKYLTVSQ